MPEKIDDILQDCLDLMRRGTPAKECLALYPELAGELAPLLAASVGAENLLVRPMGAGSRSRIWATVFGEWNRRRAPKRRWWALPAFAPIPAFAPRWAAVAASVVVALMLGGSGTVLAAGYSIPGDALYPVKQAREEVRLWLTWSPEAKVDMYTRLVNKRADEIRALAAAGRAGSSGIAAGRLEDHVANVSLLAAQAAGSSSEGPGPSRGMIARLQSSATAQQSAASIIQAMLDDAPPQARVKLVGALSAISDAKARVRAAQEAVGVTIPR